MKISDALKKIRKLKNELKRKIKIRKDNFNIIIPKDKTLEDIKKNPKEYEIIDLHEITSEINQVAGEITDLREKILRSNINTMVTIEGESISLAKLKLMIDDLRSELAQYESINERGLYERGRHKIKTSEEEEKEVPQLNDLELEKTVRELEERKMSYESTLEYMNATSELMD